MSELALRQIEENKKTRALFLDLGNCGLTEVPTEIGELGWLEKLSFASEWQNWPEGEWRPIQTENSGSANKIPRIPPFISRLSNLKQLYLNGSTSVRLEYDDLTHLKGLINLEILDISATKVSDLSPLVNLTKLVKLCAWDTDVIDISPVSKLLCLEKLDISRTKVVDLTPVKDLTKLKTLHIWNTLISDLTSLSGLANLTRISIWETQVSDISPLLPFISKGVSIKWQEWGVEDGIYIEGCPLTNPPPEVVQRGNAAILNYFKEKEAQGVDHLYEAKLLIVGEGGSGKTSLLRRLYQIDKPLPDETETTKGIDIYRHEFKLSNGRNFRLNVWDFGGQEIYHATHQFFLTKRSLYVLLDDTRKDYKTIHDEGFKYWLEVVDQLSDHSPLLIFQNEKGGRSKTIDEAGIKGHFTNVKEIYQGNLELKDATDTLRKGIEHYIQELPHIGEEQPKLWVSIRRDIETLSKQKPFISQKEYFDLYSKHLPFDWVKAMHLSRYFHDLGVFLHFQDDPLLAHTVILQNKWATDAVFKILDDEIVKKKRGRFNAEDCERVWQDSVYAHMHPELLALMQKFELCYRLPDSDPETWLAPELIDLSKPNQLTNWEQHGDLLLRYRYEFMPKGLINRLMVRLHRFVPQPELGWVTGVYFERDGSQVLVEIPPKGGEITLRARGPERKELLSVIAADLDVLNDSFQGLKERIEKLVPCNCLQCLNQADPNSYELTMLKRFKADGVLKWKCSRSYADVDVMELLDGISVKKLPGWINEFPNTNDRFRRPNQHRFIVFLASSSELQEDRDEFELYCLRQNNRQNSYYLEIIRWENFLDAMSETRLQNEYNQAVRECDIFVSLFFTKTGKFTEEEFDVAHQQFMQTKKPRIYTFFKNADVNINRILREDFLSLDNFKNRLGKLGHFCTGYDNIEHLKRQFKDQLEKLLDDGL